jgi:hypothetical protein
MADSSLSRHPFAGVPGLERFARIIVASQVAFAVIALRYNNGPHRRRFFTGGACEDASEDSGPRPEEKRSCYFTTSAPTLQMPAF